MEKLSVAFNNFATVHYKLIETTVLLYIGINIAD